jgi:hypothetical protein
MKAPVFFLLMIAIVVAIIAANVLLLRKRTNDLAAVAGKLRMDFFPAGNSSIAPMLCNLEFFMYGSHCKVKNLMRGNINRNGKTVSVAIFDYEYTICPYRNTEFSFNDGSISVGSNSNSESFYHSQTVLVFYDESLDIPSFSLRPEHLWDKLANLVGCQDINFENFPTFSKRYRLLTNQEADVRNLFQSNLINFYESNKLCSEAIGPHLLIFPFGRKNRTHQVVNNQTFVDSQYLDSDQIKPHLDLGLRLLNLFEKNISAVRK